MATAAARPRRKVRTDDVFFSGMAVVSLIAVFAGFARTYFLAGVFRAPLPNLLIHIHGAIFTLWIILFVSQIGLVTARRLTLHRRIGLLGFGLAVLMIVLGVLAASDRLTRHVGEPGKETPEDVRAFYAIPMGDVLMFATFISLGYRNRSNPADTNGSCCSRPLHFWMLPSIRESALPFFRPIFPVHGLNFDFLRKNRVYTCETDLPRVIFRSGWERLRTRFL
jgi:hypothetical protein